jgi:hypothetical protein
MNWLRDIIPHRKLAGLAVRFLQLLAADQVLK